MLTLNQIIVIAICVMVFAALTYFMIFFFSSSGRKQRAINKRMKLEKEVALYQAYIKQSIKKFRGSLPAAAKNLPATNKNKKPESQNRT